MTKIYYTTEPEFDDYCSLDVDPHDHVDDYIRDIARDLYDEHDGWDMQWPLVIWVWENESTLIGTYDVFMEADPKFYASRVKVK
jgi:hypothetical protein